VNILHFVNPNPWPKQLKMNKTKMGPETIASCQLRSVEKRSHEAAYPVDSSVYLHATPDYQRATRLSKDCGHSAMPNALYISVSMHVANHSAANLRYTQRNSQLTAVLSSRKETRPNH